MSLTGHGMKLLEELVAVGIPDGTAKELASVFDAAWNDAEAVEWLKLRIESELRKQWQERDIERRRNECRAELKKAEERFNREYEAQRLVMLARREARMLGRDPDAPHEPGPKRTQWICKKVSEGWTYKSIGVALGIHGSRVSDVWKKEMRRRERIKLSAPLKRSFEIEPNAVYFESLREAFPELQGVHGCPRRRDRDAPGA